MNKTELKTIYPTFLFLLFSLNWSFQSYSQLFESIFAPEHHVVFRCPEPPVIDGSINESIWDAAPWTNSFVDIEGSDKPKPFYDTNVKMLWDNKFLYIAARLYDEHIWATLKEDESVIFQDNDFEVFIDPNGDSHGYMELEINAFGTTWDLFMDKPYRDGGYADSDWHFGGMKSAVKVYGKINRTTGKDSCWTVEIALPLKTMIEFSESKKIPVDGEQWRINFSRVQWKTKIKDYEYHKEKAKNGKPLPEMNWVWSPQGNIAMHQPETWGYLQFSDKIAGDGTDSFIENPDSKIIWSLWQVYYLYQRYPYNYKKLEQSFSDIKNKKAASSADFKMVSLGNKKDGYIARAQSTTKTGYWLIRKDGKIWFEKTKRKTNE